MIKRKEVVKNVGENNQKYNLMILFLNQKRTAKVKMKLLSKGLPLEDNKPCKKEILISNLRILKFSKSLKKKRSKEITKTEEIMKQQLQ